MRAILICEETFEKIQPIFNDLFGDLKSWIGMYFIDVEDSGLQSMVNEIALFKDFSFNQSLIGDYGMVGNKDWFYLTSRLKETEE